MRYCTVVAAAIAATLITTGALFAGQAAGANRFEVTSLRGVRPILVKTVADLEKKDLAAAKRDMEDYDSAWNGVEVYVNTRSKEMYDEIEHNWRATLKRPSGDSSEYCGRVQSTSTDRFHMDQSAHKLPRRKAL